MSLKEKIEDVNKSFSKMKEEHSNKYKECLIEELERLGVYKVDVYRKSSCKRGVLTLIREHHADIRWTVVFTPYKKDGTLSLVYESLYIWDFMDFSDALMSKISKEMEMVSE